MTITLAEERLDQYRLCTECSCITSEARSLVDDAFSSWRRVIKPRDRISLTISYDGESLTITDISESSHQRVYELLDLNEEDEARLSFELTINKNVKDRLLSLYSPALFGKYLQSTPIIQILAVLATRLDKKLTFESIEPINPSGSSSIFFQYFEESSEDSKPQSDSDSRCSVFETFKDNCFSRSLPGFFTPHDFDMPTETGIPDIDSFLRKCRTLVSVIYIANSAELRDGEILEYRLCGYKNITGSSSLSDLANSSDLIYKIVDWAYKSGGNSDKIGLARNVLTLYIEKLQDLPSHPEILHAINSNYQIYLKENVESYLEVKGKITDILVDAIKKTHDLVDSFLDSLKNGIFVLLTFVLTVVVVNGLKDTSASTIFSQAYISVIIILCILMSIWVWSAQRNSLKQFDKAYDSIEKLLKQNYQSVLAEAEIDSALHPIRASNRTYLISQSTHYVRIWLLIVTLLTAGFIAGNSYFTPIQPVSKPETPQPNKDALCPPTSPNSQRLDQTELVSDPSQSAAASKDNQLDRRVDLRKRTTP